MKYVRPAVTILEQENSWDGLRRHIELAGRRFSDNREITSDSAAEFVRTQLKKKDPVVLEHGTVYVTCTDQEKRLIHSPYAYTVTDGNGNCYVTTDYRHYMHTGMESVPEPTGFHIRRVTFRITCSLRTACRLMLHRYLTVTVNGRENSEELLCVMPSWMKGVKNNQKFTEKNMETEEIVKALVNKTIDSKVLIGTGVCICAEKACGELLRLGAPAWQAEDLLPGLAETEVVVTGTLPQWRLFIDSAGENPDLAGIGNMIHDLLAERGYIPAPTGK